MISASDKRIAKNTVFLYGRTVLTLFIALYTSRVVLEKLGASDFGIFNLVAGFLTIFSFLQGSAASATLRFITFEIGAGNEIRLKQTFATSLAFHLAISTAIVLLGETVGLWFVNTQLEIDPLRMTAANYVYQLAIVSMVFTIMQIPYASVIMARERLDVYAVIMLLQALLRLGIAMALVWFADADTLIWYAVLYTLATAVVSIIFMAYSMRHFSESHAVPKFHKGITRSLTSFSGYDTYGNFCSVARLQGMALIINRFGGTILNASAALATNVSSAFQSFSNTILLAFKPRMTKEFAVCNYAGTSRVVYNCACFSLLLAGMMMVPLFWEMDMILSLWLGTVPPPYTADFCRICIITSCADAVNASIYSGIHATGRINVLSMLNGTLGLLELGVMYLLLKWLRWPPVVYAAHLSFVLLCICTAALILRRQLGTFSVRRLFFRKLSIPFLIVAVAMATCYATATVMADGFWRLMLMCVISLAICASGTYFLIMDASMRAQARTYVMSRLTGIKRRKS